MTVSLIRAEHVDLVWPSLWPLLGRAARLPPGRSEAGVRAVVDRGDAQLWAVLKGKPVAALTTQITLLPDRRCRLWLIGGAGMAGWAGELLAVIEPWARSHGCTWIWGYGRRGWKQIAQAMGGEPIDMPEAGNIPTWGRRII